MHEITLVAQLLFSTATDVTSGIDSLPASELCEMYARGMNDDTLLTEDREDDPCLDMDSPMDYIVD